MKIFFAFFIAVLLIASPVSGQEKTSKETPSIEEKTKGFEKKDGFMPIYWDAKAGKVWLEVGLWDTDFLYVTSLPAGLGSNDIGLDRGLLGNERVVQFQRVGPKVLLVAPNFRYRATSTNEQEQKAVRDAFASSIAWGFAVAAQTDDRVLVDATAFLMRDVMGISRRLNGMKQGSFKLDLKRSTPYLPMLKAFPKNTEMEAQLTFLSDNPGRYVREVASDPSAITLRLRQSFVALPELGSYKTRLHDPRSGAYGITYVDYATPISAPKEVRYTARHRLEKQNPAAPVSEPIEPIVYYLDLGTPEPIRSALLDGARWWEDAFEAAGFSNAYRVEMMPEDADPMDLRYNVIQWVHRSTRGWSYGRSIQDPRTGEILKGHVSLGSLRVRQDYLIAEGLLAPYDSEEKSNGLSPDNDPMLELALARLRQLSAHEVGHTLGFMHNFAASVNGRASVMDYPAPMATLTAAGDISISDAYDVGIGAWDIATVKFSYSQFTSDQDERTQLNAILDQAYEDGYYYLTDSDARPQGGAHPLGHLWDNGINPIDQLDLSMQIRQTALDKFGLANIKANQPLAQLEEVLVPLYLHHRFQVEAVVKLIGGVDYSYAMRGDARRLPSAIPKEEQLAAVDALLATVTPAALRLPENLRTQLPPRPPGYGQHRELFDGYTGLTFDPYAPAQVAAGMVADLIANPQRMARLVYQEDFDSDLPGLNDIFNRVFDKVWKARTPKDPYDAELQRVVQQSWTDALLAQVTNPNVAPAARARVIFHLREILSWLERSKGNNSESIAHRDMVYEDVQRVLTREYQKAESWRTVTTPPGSPIGQEAPSYLLRTEQRRSLLNDWVQENAFCGVTQLGGNIQ
ncbi:MAG: zinc-dependent metalloprotease [Rhodothermales bacterium]